MDDHLRASEIILCNVILKKRRVFEKRVMIFEYLFDDYFCDNFICLSFHWLKTIEGKKRKEKINTSCKYKRKNYLIVVQISFLFSYNTMNSYFLIFFFLREQWIVIGQLNMLTIQLILCFWVKSHLCLLTLVHSCLMFAEKDIVDFLQFYFVCRTYLTIPNHWTSSTLLIFKNFVSSSNSSLNY